MNPNPTCEKDCRFHTGFEMTTDTYYPPVYDKHGNNVNPDRNIISGSIRCSVCNKQWMYGKQMDKITYKEIIL